MERKPVPWSLWMLMAVQGFCILVVAFVPIGFDNPSSAGLDFGHLLLLLLGAGLSWLAGSIAAAALKRWGLLSLQLSTPVLMVAAVFLGDMG